MFVQENSLKAVKQYFQDRLSDQFDDREIRQITKWLVRYRTNVSDTDFMLGSVKFSESDLLYFKSAKDRLINGEPIQYILGSTWFCDLEFISDSRALIPRPETEELVRWVAESHDRPLRFADICAGSGCIALATKSIRPEWEVLALEIDDDALSLIQENMSHLDMEIEVMKFDALSKDIKIEPKVDVIVSNPPYIPPSDKNSMSTNVLDYEPHLALFVPEEDPLLFYRHLIQNAREMLNDKGWMYFEVHEDLGEDVAQLMRSLTFFNIQLRKDLQGKVRMVAGQLVLSPHGQEFCKDQN